MTIIELDARPWLQPADFYSDLLTALGAPDWHGYGVDALVDSLIFGHINKVEPPLRIQIYGWQSAPVSVRDAVLLAMDALADEGAQCFRDDLTASIALAPIR